MKIGFPGAGTVAKTIARHALAFEHQLLLSNRHPALGGQPAYSSAGRHPWRQPVSVLHGAARH